MDKILVTAPTAKAKNYCLKEWLLNASKIYHPIDIVLFDNTVDNGENTKYLNQIALENQVFNFEAIHTKTDHIESLIERMCISHNMCREYAINNGYTHMLHLESDVFCPPDCIEKLLTENKQVIGALFYRDSGISRRLMVERRIHQSPKNIMVENFLPTDDISFVDGAVKEVASVGLGCVLIHKSVFNKIPFRFIAGEDMFPDSYFSGDCFFNKIKIFSHTDVVCRHDSEQWGIHGIHFS